MSISTFFKQFIPGGEVPSESPAVAESGDSVMQQASAATSTAYEPLVQPKGLKKLAQVIGAHFTSVPSGTKTIAPPELNTASTDPLSYRAKSGTDAQLQAYAKASPELSNAVFINTRIGVPQRYTVIARNRADNSISRDATETARIILAGINYIRDSLGFDVTKGIQAISESLARDLMLSGYCGAELVLDKSGIPVRIQPFSASVIRFKSVEAGFQPYQKVGDKEISLDIPTVVIAQLDNDLRSPYPTSQLLPAIRAIIFSEMHMNDILRVIQRATFPRVKVVIDEEKFRKNMPESAKFDADEAEKHMQRFTAEIESMVNGLQPEDALIYFDTIGISVEEVKGVTSDFVGIRELHNGRLSSATHVPTSVLGIESGSASSNIASTEVAIYIRSVDSSIRQKLNNVYSRLLTTAVRLLGYDCYIEFEYEELNIRPATELAAFRQTEQSIILDLLSLGMVTDEEACIRLTGNLPPIGYVNKSGTMFRHGTATQANTSLYGGASNSGSTLNQNLNADTPTTGRGGNSTNQKGNQ